MSKKWLLGLFLIISLSVMTACNGESAEEKNEETDDQEGQPTEQAEMPKADIEGIPEVVAEVNTEEISKEEFVPVYEAQFQRFAMQAQMTGQEFDQNQLRKQVAESMVGTKLLMQEADNRNYTVSEAEIDETLTELVGLNGLESQEALMEALEQQGMDEEKVMSEIETQVKISRLVVEESGEIVITDEELQEAYDQVKAMQEQMGGDEADVPSFEEVKPDLEEQLKMEKEGEATQALVAELRENADVTIHL